MHAVSRGFSNYCTFSLNFVIMMLVFSSRWLLIVGGLVLCSITVKAQSNQATPNPLAALLKASRWQKRVLLLCAPTADDAALRRQQELLIPARADLAERDLLVREVVMTKLSAADQRYLTQRLGVQTGAFTVVLIGKDGGVKRRESQPTPPDNLFSTIDAMPMRQQEMRNR